MGPVTYAQVSTNISPTPGTFTQGNLGTQVADPRVEGLNTIHDITGGTRPGYGTNLFHSFDQLNVGEQHIANFLNNTGLPTNNILSRVIGGDPSQVFGTLQTTGFPNANLFLLNPAGIVFGPNAKVDIKGAFYASTADFLQLGQDGIFYPSLTKESVLTAAAPEAFGFLGADPPTIASTNSASIFVEGLDIKNEQSVTLVSRDAIAGEQRIDGLVISGGTLQSPNGQVTLISIGGSQALAVQRVSVNLESLSTQGMNEQGEVIPEPVAFGSMTLEKGAHLDTSGSRGGTVVIRGGILQIEESRISANISGANTSNSKAAMGTGIDIDVAEDVTITNGTILETNVLPDTSPESRTGGIRVKANQVEVSNQSLIESNTASSNVESGDITVEANSLLIDSSAMRANTSGADGDSGDISLTADTDIVIQNSSLLITLAFNGISKAGDIMLDADSVLLSGTPISFPEITSQVGPDASKEGSSGGVRVTANQFEMFNALMSTGTFGAGDAGNIDINVERDVTISGSGDFNAPPFGIAANSLGSGEGGRFELSAYSLKLANLTSIQASTLSTGGSGGLTITLSGDLDIQGGAFIQTRAIPMPGSTGNSGDLNITAQDIVITGISDAINFEASPEFTGISASTFDGQGGDLTIEAKNLTVSDKAFVNTATTGSGNSGKLSIELSEKLEVLNGGQIFADAQVGSSGNAGDVDIKADSVVVSDANPTLSRRVDGSEFSPTRSAITSQSRGDGGKAGNIQVTAERLSLLNGAAITAESSSTGTAGNITLTGNDSIIITDSAVTTQAEKALGGRIELIAQNLIQITNSEITSRVQEGSASAGSISVDPQFIVVRNSLIDTSANVGTGGDVTFVADSAILIDPFSTIDTSSQFGGNGTIDIRAPIQNLSETIAPLPEALIKISALFAARCAAQKGGTFSSFTNESGLTPTPSSFLPSPLTFSTFGREGTTTTASRLNFNKIINKTVWKFLTTSKTLNLPQGCSSAPVFPS